ncbi:MAG: flavodoxin domain-containing protein, partial [Tepidiformaceae bacterium]
MKVLVAYASKHGSTAEIARAIALDLRADGLAVDVQQAGDVSAVQPYDAVILGSAVYMGHWLDAARDLAAREAVALRQRDVWLFSTGPIGEPPKPAENAVDVSEVM